MFGLACPVEGVSIATDDPQHIVVDTVVEVRKVIFPQGVKIHDTEAYLAGFVMPFPSFLRLERLAGSADPLQGRAVLSPSLGRRRDEEASALGDATRLRWRRRSR